jgi:hypothetical protein
MGPTGPQGPIGIPGLNGNTLFEDPEDPGFYTIIPG